MYFIADCDLDGTTVNAAFAISHRVGEGGWAVISLIRRKGDGAVGIQSGCAGTVFECNYITRLNRCTVDFGDGQWVAIRILVIAQNIEGDWGVFFGGAVVVSDNRRIINRRDRHVNIGCYRRASIADGVAEGRWTVVVGFRCEGDGAVCIQGCSAVFNRYRHTNGHILTINLQDSEFIAINVGIIGQYVDNDWGVFRCGGCVI